MGREGVQLPNTMITQTVSLVASVHDALQISGSEQDVYNELHIVCARVEIIRSNVVEVGELKGKFRNTRRQGDYRSNCCSWGGAKEIFSLF